MPSSDIVIVGLRRKLRELEQAREDALRRVAAEFDESIDALRNADRVLTVLESRDEGRDAYPSSGSIGDKIEFVLRVADRPLPPIEVRDRILERDPDLQRPESIAETLARSTPRRFFRTDAEGTSVYGLAEWRPTEVEARLSSESQLFDEMTASNEGVSVVSTKSFRHRLPRGYMDDQVCRFASEVRRFFHIGEVERAVNEAIERDFPNQPHLEVPRGSLNRALRSLFEDGKLVRVTYDGHSHYYFHADPSCVKKGAEGLEFAGPECAPPDEFLEGVKNRTPHFPEPES